MGRGAEPAAWQPIRAAARPEGRGSPVAQGAGLRLTVAVAGVFVIFLLPECSRYRFLHRCILLHVSSGKAPSPPHHVATDA